MGCGSSKREDVNTPEMKAKSDTLVDTTEANPDLEPISNPELHTFRTDYNPELNFQLTVKTLKGGPVLTLEGVKPQLTGRELHEMIKSQTGNQTDMLLVLSGGIIMSDEVEIGKKVLSKEATVYCVYKPKERASS